MREEDRLDRSSALLRTALLVGILSIGSTALAVDFTQPPSAFTITTDGIFTTPVEWSDVMPAERLGGDSLVYTSTDPGLGGLYLMYDLPSSTTPLPPGSTAGPVHFHNSDASFEVFFTCPSSILVLKDGLPFDVSDPGGGEDSIEGACGFGPSPSAAIPHNMFELEVLFDGSDPTLAGHNHGQYSPDPSHWGAGLPTDPNQLDEPRCEVPDDPNCDGNNDPTGGGEPGSVPCPPGVEPGRDPNFRVSFGEEVSNACVNVVRGSGGDVLITGIPIPGGTPSGLDHFQCWQVKDLKNPKFEKRGVTLNDQFAAGDVEVKTLSLICAPADKDGSGINDPDTHQCCYKIKGPKFTAPPRVRVTDQFGNHVAEVKKAKFLCQPCSKTVLP